MIFAPTVSQDAAVYDSRVRHEHPDGTGTSATGSLTVGHAESDRRQSPLDATVAKFNADAPVAPRMESYARAYVRESLGPKYEMLVRQRQRLVLKRLHDKLSPSEQQRLQYAQWRIDRYEEALLGDDWDRLKESIARQRTLGAEIRAFIDDLRSTSPTAFKPRRR